MRYPTVLLLFIVQPKFGFSRIMMHKPLVYTTKWLVFFYNQSSVNATSVANLPIKIWCISRLQKKPKINSDAEKEEAALVKIFFCSALTVLNRLSPPLFSAMMKDMWGSLCFGKSQQKCYISWLKDKNSWTLYLQRKIK